MWVLVTVVSAEQMVLRRSIGLGLCAAAAAAILMVAGALGLILALRERKEQARFVAVLAAAACAAAIAAGMGVETGRAALASLSESPISSWSFHVTGDARLQSGRFRMRAQACKDGAVSTDVWLYCDERLYPGTTVAGVGRLQDLGAGLWAAGSRAQGVNAGVSLIRIGTRSYRGGLLGLVDSVRLRLTESFSPGSGTARAFMAACVVGDRTGLDALEVDGILRRCGISHLVAVSGTHLALVAGACSSLLGRSRLRPRTRAAVLACTTAAFVLLCGAPPSAVRAGLMVLLHAASRLAGRRSHGTSSLCAAALAMALVDPGITGQLAYQLSVAAVLGIYVVNPYLRYLLEVLCAHASFYTGPLSPIARQLHALERAARDLLALSLTAQLVTLPVASAAFSELSIVAPLANLIAAPPIALLTLAGLASCALLPVPPAQELLFAVLEPFGQLLMTLLSAISRPWWAALPVSGPVRLAGIALLLPVLALSWVSPRLERAHIVRALCCLIAALGLWYAGMRYFAPARICVLDVGQGDAILIQEGPHAVLVDAGPAGALEGALLRNGVFHLDAIILSHFHDDHYGGIADLAGCIPCDAILVAAGSGPSAPQELVSAAQSLDAHPFGELSYLDEIRFGHFLLTVAAPVGEVDGLENEDSMFLLLAYDDGRRRMSALLAGDGESGELAGVIARRGMEGIDILKVGHHGSEGSITAEQAGRLGCAYALASAGAGNPFGHPHDRCAGILADAGALFLCTKDVGDIEMVPAPGGAQPSRRG